MRVGELQQKQEMRNVARAASFALRASAVAVAGCLQDGAGSSRSRTSSEVPVREDKNPAEDGLGDDVEHGVGDVLAFDADGTGALGEDPDDRVDHPRDDSDVHGTAVGALARAWSCRSAEVDADVAEFEGFAIAGQAAEEVDDGDEAEHGEAEESPLVAAVARVLDEGADEAGYNHDDVDGAEEKAGVEVGAADDREVVEHERGCDDPVT